jgi:nucleoside-diphosphate-sugar epimerase
MKDIVVISGAAGMTGSLLAADLLDRGNEVIGFDNYFAGSRDVIADLLPRKGFYFFDYDITNTANMDSLFAHLRSNYDEPSLSAFVNCGAVVHTKHFYCPDDTFKTNVVAMRDTLDRAVRIGFSIYINCSSSEVYSMKSYEEGGVLESTPVLMATAEQSMRTSYATGKLLTEFFMRDVVERGRIKGCSIRFANVYSPSEAHEEHLIPFVISSLLRDGRVLLFENARETRRTFLHNSDSCSAVTRLLYSPAALDGTVYNIGTDEEITVVDLVNKIARLMGLEDVSVDYSGRRSADPPRRLLNTKKLCDMTGWAPKISLDEGLRQCIEFQRKRLKGV